MTKFFIPFSSYLSYKVNLPDVCVYCCSPATKTIGVELKTQSSSQEGVKQTITTRSTTLKIPYCSMHNSEDTRNTLILWGIKLLLLVIAFLISTPLRDFLFNLIGRPNDLVQFPKESFFCATIPLTVFLGILAINYLGPLVRNLVSNFSPRLKSLKDMLLTVSFGVGESSSLGFIGSMNYSGIFASFVNTEYAALFLEANPGSKQLDETK